MSCAVSEMMAKVNLLKEIRFYEYSGITNFDLVRTHEDGVRVFRKYMEILESFRIVLGEF